jgi:hypothetical protein
MSQLDELLQDIEDGDGAGMGADEEHIVIGMDRYITVPDSLKKIAVQYDHNIETVTFDCPNFWDNHELSKMAVYVNYLRADGKAKSCMATNVRRDETNSKIMHFDWTLSREVTEAPGNISFLVCIKLMGEVFDSSGKTVLGEIAHWNSELNTDMYVSAGLEADAETKQEYNDIAYALLIRMDELEAIGLSHVVSVEEKTDGYAVTFKDSTGTKTVTLKHGINGAKGDKGEKGDPGEDSPTLTSIGLRAFEFRVGNTSDKETKLCAAWPEKGRRYRLHLDSENYNGFQFGLYNDVLKKFTPCGATDNNHLEFELVNKFYDYCVFKVIDSAYASGKYFKQTYCESGRYDEFPELTELLATLTDNFMYELWIFEIDGALKFFVGQRFGEHDGHEATGTNTPVICGASKAYYYLYEELVYIGEKGEKGDKGDKGEKGDKGDTGDYVEVIRLI